MSKKKTLAPKVSDKETEAMLLLQKMIIISNEDDIRKIVHSLETLIEEDEPIAHLLGLSKSKVKELGNREKVKLPNICV